MQISVPADFSHQTISSLSDVDYFNRILYNEVNTKNFSNKENFLHSLNFGNFAESFINLELQYNSSIDSYRETKKNDAVFYNAVDKYNIADNLNHSVSSNKSIYLPNLILNKDASNLNNNDVNKNALNIVNTLKEQDAKEEIVFNRRMKTNDMLGQASSMRFTIAMIAQFMTNMFHSASNIYNALSRSS